MRKKDFNPKVSIIILNWNGKKDTIPCLESLKKIEYKNYNVIIVDNGSTDGSLELIENQYPDLTLLKNKENLGFTGGNNVGIDYALKHDADYLYLLNNDTLVDEKLLSSSLDIFSSKPSIGLVGPKVVYYSNLQNVWCAGCYYNSVLGRAVMYGTFSKKKDFKKSEVVDWISFCAVMIKREVFEKIRKLDDDFFSSYEDLDFCMRAKRAGFLCYYTPDTVVQHKIAQDWGGLDSPLYIYYQVRNALLCMKKNRTLISYWISLIIYLFVSLPRRAYSLIKKRKTKNIKYIWYGILDFKNKQYRKGVLSEKIRKEQKKVLRIGINARYLQRKISGIERYIQELLIHLGDIDHETEYYLFFNKHAPIPSLNLPSNFKIIVSSFPSNNQILRIIWDNLWLAYEIKKYHINVFHGPAFFLPLVKIKSCKYIVTVHDMTFIKFKEMFTQETYWYYQFFFNLSVNHADMIICDSVSTKKDLLEHDKTISSDKIIVIYLGVKKQPHIKSKAEIKHKYNLPDSYYLFVGTISPRKNLLRVIKAWNQRINKDHKLVIIGKKGWLYNTFFEYIEKNNLSNDVLWLDYIPEEDLPSFYSYAEALLFPSLYEGFGLPILEAMSCGCPVITSNISSMPEVAADAALLVDPYNINEIKRAIEKLTTNKKLREKLIKKGYENLKRFNWKNMAKKIITIYTQLANRRM